MEEREKEAQREPEREITREEILERSRREGARDGDERRRGLWKYYPYSGLFGGLIAICVCLIVFVAYDLGGLYITTILTILITINTSQIVFEAIMFKRKKMKIILAIFAALCAVCMVGMWVIFGLEAAGVAI